MVTGWACVGFMNEPATSKVDHNLAQRTNLSFLPSDSEANVMSMAFPFTEPRMYIDTGRRGDGSLEHQVNAVKRP